MKKILSSLIVFGLSMLVYWLTVPLSDCYIAQWRTFYWDRHYCNEILAQHSGAWQLIQDFYYQAYATTTGIAAVLAVFTTVLVSVAYALLGKIGALHKVMDTTVKQSGVYALLFVLTTVCTMAVRGYFTSSADKNVRAMMCLAADNKWDTIIEEYSKVPSTTKLENNLKNMAYAERGQLSRRFTANRHPDVNDLFVLEINSSPYVAALLSDIYWTMGEITMSQMYAFEANEKLGNLSPRLLKRLALTNIVMGEYRVAEKYIDWLSKTVRHHSWAEYYRTKLSDEAVMADEYLSLKRRCVPEENGFPSSRSIPYDLQQIVNRNPGHLPSSEYLKAIGMLR
ncbi:MAG: hypothetical protein KBT20_01045 [Bacteroidales bacterium]|nr:hypothetical protein [Candidatus Liminaster caballi]